MINTFPPTYKLILKRLLPRRPLKILDLGCGIGTAAEVLNKDKIYDFTGVDIYEPYLNICRKRGYYKEIKKGDLRKIKFAKNSFDLVILLQVIEHLNKREAIEVIEKAFNIAKMAVLISVPNGYCEQKSVDGNIFNKHRSTWFARDLIKMGFNVYGQGLKIIYGTKSYEGRIEANRLQKITVFLSVFFFPFILFFPKVAVQLIAIKYLGDKKK